jgi:hypothetical protein
MIHDEKRDRFAEARHIGIIMAFLIVSLLIIPMKEGNAFPYLVPCSKQWIPPCGAHHLKSLVTNLRQSHLLNLTLW